ncbi:helix-turn-helix domain-containing protein [Adhaeribacter aerolatus]|uniref:helix-turn-helix domain-containing protein n=1 Tax=Adhaeribacter aerolatus TaxID=670289 RepID=UPI0011BFC369|nr:helix-turn-helix domain-containing protein [Adhaeribacter aerolatus]
MEQKELIIKFCIPEGGELLQAFVKALLPHLNPPSSETLQLPPVNEEKPISKNEACRFLGCSAPTLTKWMANGTIPFSRKGRRVYFLKSLILKSLEQPIILGKETKRCR